MKRISLPMTTEKRPASQHLPMTREGMAARGWNEVDVVFVTGDAYVDHPSFAMAILGRVLEAAGFRVAILSQPDWRSCEPWRQFGRPRLFFAVSAGNMDSMINHYTANKKVRNDDAYSPGGRIGLRPDRATLVYCQRAREAYHGVPIIAGGVEASLRRLAHYDYWSDTVRRAIMLDAKCDLVAYGMGEKVIVEIARILDQGGTVKDLRRLRGVAYALGAKESQALASGRRHPSSIPSGGRQSPVSSSEEPQPSTDLPFLDDFILLPSYEEVKADKYAFAEATRIIHINTNPYNAKTLVQFHDRQAVVVNPPALPLSQEEMDQIYDLPYTRRPHPSYTEPIPAYEMIKDSVTIMRGCFGGCTFCSITAHQGRIIQSRSQESVLREIQRLNDDPEFKGIVSDIGGPTANMYQMRCTRPEVEAKCKRLSCVHPTICKLLGTDHGPLIELMRQARAVPGIRKVLVASGIRMDLAQLSPEYLRELAAHHVGGHLKVAPEHTDPHVLERMKKPPIENFQGFARAFRKASERAGKPKQYLVPYFIASHPGSDLHAMIDLALFLKRNGYRPDQVQDFIPAPFDIATCMYYTGMDPFTKEPVYVARDLRNRRMQRALMQFFKPENWFEVRKALIEAGRSDLIGGCDGLIPAHPPREAIEARRRRANENFSGEYTHAIAPPRRNTGYRPGRKTARRQIKPGRAPKQA
ncbi:MAG: YgiQ family radical SAM protein [Gemmatales bacterium]|nr:YgiQ family radical SAM protein [Gemmatales bacterium]MDW8387643.1 YgiQ family radical SAM protein [Gemmatales bacterium]